MAGGLGSNTVHGIFPKGQKAGLNHQDLGEQTLKDPNGGQYQGYRTHYKWDNGLTVRDWRYAVRIANIDTTKLGADNGPNGEADGAGFASHPNLQMGKAVFYMNRDAAEYRTFRQLKKLLWRSALKKPKVCGGLRSAACQCVPAMLC